MLKELLESIPQCAACWLMADNSARGIRYVPIRPKPQARVVFIGRDPSPRTALTVGDRGGNSSFINEIFRIVDAAGVSEEDIYITDICKCHWRTSRGAPVSGTEDRRPRLDPNVAAVCRETWLTRELSALEPRLIVAFGAELYQHLKPSILEPFPAPEKFSASKGKDRPDAESWFVANGPMTLRFSTERWPLAVLRHPGNSRGMRRGAAGDKRWEYHNRATERVVAVVRQACARDAG